MLLLGAAQVLLHPMPRTASWNGQLSPYLLQVNEQLLLQPSAVLLSVVRALHVLRGVLQEVRSFRSVRFMCVCVSVPVATSLTSDIGVGCKGGLHSFVSPSYILLTITTGLVLSATVNPSILCLPH